MIVEPQPALALGKEPVRGRSCLFLKHFRNDDLIVFNPVDQTPEGLGIGTVRYAVPARPEEGGTATSTE